MVRYALKFLFIGFGSAILSWFPLLFFSQETPEAVDIALLLGPSVIFSSVLVLTLNHIKVLRFSLSVSFLICLIFSVASWLGAMTISTVGMDFRLGVHDQNYFDLVASGILPSSTGVFLVALAMKIIVQRSVMDAGQFIVFFLFAGCMGIFVFAFLEIFLAPIVFELMSVLFGHLATRFEEMISLLMLFIGWQGIFYSSLIILTEHTTRSEN